MWQNVHGNSQNIYGSMCFDTQALDINSDKLQ